MFLLLSLPHQSQQFNTLFSAANYAAFQKVSDVDHVVGLRDKAFLVNKLLYCVQIDKLQISLTESEGEQKIKERY